MNLMNSPIETDTTQYLNLCINKDLIINWTPSEGTKIHL